MIFTSLMFELAKGSVQLRRDGDKLQYRAKKGTLDSALLNGLREHKAAIFEWIGSDIGKWLEAGGMTTADRTGPLPLSFAQQRLWFLDQLEEKAGLAYHIYGGVRLTGILDTAALKKTLDGIVERHEALRTTFTETDGVPLQVIAPPQNGFYLFEHDLTGSSKRDLEGLISEEAETPFDLAEGPLIRGRLIRMSESKHILLVTMHHIVSDGWSMGVFINELSALYQAFSKGQEDPLPPLTLQYADYAVWQRRWLEGDVLQQQLAYWREQLRSAPALLELPTDYPRPAVQDFTGQDMSFVLDAEVTQDLKAFSQRHGVTLFMTLLAGWAVLLSRLSDQSDIVIGVPMANRMRSEIEPLIGFFVNTLALRVDLADQPTVVELLTRVKQLTIEGQSHQDIPFEQVVEAVEPVRSLAHSPLFQVMFAWQNNPEGRFEMGELQLEGIETPSTTTHFDLSLTLQEAGNEITGALEYATALFEQSTIKRHLDSYQILLKDMVAKDEQRVDQLRILSQAERQQVLYDWNATQTEYPKDKCIHQLFEAQVDKAPDAVAVVYEDKLLTYGQLNRQANQLAHQLIETGVKPDTPVAICMERSLEMVVGLLAILKAGGAYVPIDPAYPDDRLAFMLKNSAPLALLSQRALRERWSTLAGPIAVIELDAETQVWQKHATSNPNPRELELTAQNLAYLIYTSGSTGEPKGVMVEHRNLSNLIHWHCHAFSLKENNSSSCLAGFGFDASTWEIWPPLCIGAKLMLAPASVAHDPEALLTWWQNQPLDVSFVPTPIAEHAFAANIAHAQLRTLLTGGDRLHRLPGPCSFDLINNYGPTEATVVATSGKLESCDKVLHIGRPIANTQIYILDRHHQPVPIGVIGELYVGGAGVARGYLTRPELTKERFLPDPFTKATSEEPFPRMYKTGDLGRYLPDGTIAYLGRNDFQVKIRGFRIELGEIEAGLLAIDGVTEAIVLAAEDAYGDKRLIAYYTGSEELSVETLRTHLSRLLPGYMLPAAFVRLEVLPLTPNGKLDRKALPAPEGDAFAVRVYEAPQGGVEQRLAAIWSDLLHIEKIGRFDNFFELGGHSLLAVTLISNMREQGLTAHVRTLFTSPVLSELAVAVGNEQPASMNVPPNLIPADCEQITPELLPLVDLTQANIERIVECVPGGAVNIQDIYPLSPLQEGIFFHHLMANEGDAYLLPMVFAFVSKKKLEGFIDALQKVIDRHDILRTAVLWEGLPEPVQVVWRNASLPVEEVILSGEQAEEELYSHMDPRCHRIDLCKAPMIRAFIGEDKVQGRWLLGILNHHLAADHTSLELMVEEVQAHLIGEQQHLPKPLAYRNFVTQACYSVSRQEHEGFFTEMLGTVEEPTAPFGLMDVQGDGSGITEAALALDSTLCLRLRDSARKMGVSVAVICHLAWAQVLSRLTGREDVVFGTVLFGRMQSGQGADRVMGMFINTLPVRMVAGDESVEQAVRTMHTLLGKLLHHEHAPLSLAQRCSAVKSPAPLFTTLLNYRYNQGSTASDIDSTVWEGMEVLSSESRTNYPLMLVVDDFGEDLALSAQVLNPIDPKRICEYMQTTLVHLADAFEQTPQIEVRSIEVMGEAERQQVLYDWNTTETGFPRDSCIHQLFEAQVEKTPNAFAVVYENSQLTYKELNVRANRLAHHLISLGVVPDTPVAVCAERSLELVVGLIAILKAGGAYVPLHPGFPAERLSRIVEDVTPVALLAQPWLKDLPLDFPDTLSVIDMDFTAQAWDQGSPHNPAKTTVGVGPDHLAYILYTSGSTGKPKGVMIEHGGVVNYLNWAVHAFAPVKDSVVSSSMAFDLVVSSLFPPLVCGGCVTLLKEGEEIDGLEAVMTQPQKAGIVKITPSHLEILGQHFENKEEGCGVELLVIGGETLSPSILQMWQRNHPAGRFINHYGPTEAIVGCVAQDVTNMTGEVETIPIGRPIANKKIYILDDKGRPVPVGVTGELFIGGTGVARGYLNRPELTAEKFMGDPFVKETSERHHPRMYKTGDLGRYLPDGTIEFLGRNDFQVKIRGFRIETGEIEARLTEVDGVKEAVVLAREETPGNKRLIAYYTGSEDLTADSLRNRLSTVLPGYMVPVAFVHLETLPLTINGKLDRKALPAPEGDAFSVRVYEAPQGEVEQTLAAIWSDLLHVEKIGRTDDFFELGGHSLMAVRLISRIRTQLGMELPLAELFSYSSLSELATRIRSAGKSALPAITGADRNAPLPLSFAQQRLWFLDQLEEKAGLAYHIYGGVRLTGVLDTVALKKTLDGIVERHEALRTTFTEKDGVPLQVIAPSQGGFSLLEHDLTGGSKEDLERLISEEADTPFDLAQDSLIRGRLIRVSESETILLVTMHHIVSDGWSMGVFINELSALYQAFSKGQGDPLPPLAIQYADYAVWQRKWLEGDVLQQQLTYWSDRLKGAPALLELPTDHLRPAVQDFSGQSMRFVLDAEVTQALKAISQRHGVTLFMTLLAGWAVLLSRLSDQSDIVIGVPVANRMRSEIEPLIGFFVNTLALRFDLADRPTVAELLARVKQLTIEGQSHQDIPFEQVVEAAEPVRSLSYSPLFQVAFAWQNNPEGKSEMGELHLEGIETPRTTTHFDLSLTMQEDGNEIVGALEYATALFEQSTIKRHLDSYQILLQAMVGEEGQRVDQLCILSEAERQQVLYNWNATQAEYSRDQCIHQLFEAQVEKTPDAVAVAYEDEQLTYAQLNRQANQLAHYLIDAGVKPDTPVAICLERSLEMVVGLLAILKAGGAYVPLDPAYPLERLGFMLKDSAPLALLSQSGLRERWSNLSELIEIIELDAETQAWQQHSTSNPNPGELELTVQHLAYLIYTSGSTGEPKGVMVEHRNLSNLIHWHCNAFSLNENDHSSCLAGFGFDASTWEIWPPLCIGAKLMLAPASVAHDPEALLTWWQDQPLDVSFVPTPIAEHAFATNMGNTRLRSLLTGGDRLHRLPGPCSFDLINNYGPTEATVVATSGRLESSHKVLHIGRPIDNTQIYLLDQHQQPVPIGVTGELYIGGAGVARGYLNRSELTQERFLPDPFAKATTEEPVPRMYKTGDLGRWLPDGTISFLGRNDFQVKIRGFRIELGEIEAKLAAIDGVTEAIVLAAEDATFDTRLIAYYTGREDLTVETLRTTLSSVLPGYMVPAAYVRLEVLPLTPNGKLDRKALPAPEGDAFAAHVYEPPQGEVEQKLVAIWSDLLHIEKIGRFDNFFELGGHSLLAVTLISRMRKQGLSADVRMLFTSPVLSELAVAVGNEQSEAINVPPNLIPADCEQITPELLPLVDLTQADIESIVKGVPGGAVNIQDIYPLSPLQEGILFHHLMASEGDAYLLPMVFAFASKKLLDRFVDALQKVIDRHDILRTSVLWEGLPEPVQVVWRKATLSMEEVILKGEHAEEALYSRMDPRCHRIDLRSAPMMRTFIGEDKVQGRWLLGILNHHLAADHTSLILIVEEVQAHLKGEQQNLPEPLAYRNFVAQARYGVSRQEHEDFFTQMLGTVEEPTAPFGLMDVQGDGSGVTETTLALDESLCLRLRENARKMGVSVAGLCHLAWAQVLSKLTGREEVVFGTVLFGRMQGGQGADRVMGMLINTLPVRMVAGDESVEQAVRTAHTLLGRLLHHEHAPLSLAQRCSAVAPPAPLFTTLLNYRYTTQEGNGSDIDSTVWEGMEVLSSEERSNYPLSLDVDDFGESFAITAQVQAPIEPMRVCRYMSTALEKMMDALEQTPQMPVRSIEVMGQDERRQVLFDWNLTETEYPKDKCIHQLFEAQVKKHPDAVAVVYEEEKLTYAQLNRQANQLAHHLIAMGVRPDTRVAVCMERNLEMVVALLAVLKAGGAYVPLDSTYPIERLAFMIEDSAPLALLTQSACKEGWSELTAQVAVIELDTQTEVLGKLSAANPNPDELGLNPQHLAYVIYTSGSTGKPKGVMVEHKGLCNQVCFLGDIYSLNHDSRILQFASVTFDMSVEEIFPALCLGGTLVLRTDQWLSHSYEFWQLCMAYEITHLNLPCAFWQQLVSDDSIPIPDTVKQVSVGGDAITAAPLKKWFNKQPKPRLFNAYGPTEATVNATIHQMSSDLGSWRAIGHPVANTRIYILDQYGRPVPVFVPGELYIGGVGVAQGYLNRPELTAERFLPDPFVDPTVQEPTPRMYKTGDLGRYLPDGTIEFLGRYDFQVKIRGFRIELGEIEARLAKIEGIKEAVVHAREDTPGDKRLIAYYTGSADLTVETLRSQLSSVLPGYMLPAAFVRLEVLPLTPNGKLDRKALPAPEGEAFSARAYEAPQGELEQTLAAIWAELFHVKWIGRYDNFFDLGGHSLLAVQMVSMLKQAGIDLQVAAVFTHPTIERLAVTIEGEEYPALPHGAIPIRRAEGSTPLFIVHDVSGEVLYATLLANHIDTDIPIYGLVDKPLSATPLRTLSARAKRLVRIIRAIQPIGPYRIAGWSFGGVLAYETVNQLLGEDQEVEFLGLLDSIAQSEILLKEQPLVDDITLLLAFVMEKVDKTDLSLKAQLETMAQSVDLETFVKTCQEQQLLPPSMGLEDIRNYLVRLKANDRSQFSYYPVPIPIPIHLFRAMDGKSPDLDEYLGWADVLPEAQICKIPVPGTHHSIFESPQIETLGRSLSDAISQVGTPKKRMPGQNGMQLINIQTGTGSKSAIFCIPGAGATIMAFTHLTAALGEQWTVHGLQPRGFEEGEVPHSTVPSAARAYLRQISEAHPKQPLHLIGHSFGGWVAFEMALRLRATGRDVASITIIDTEPPDGNGIIGREYNHTEIFMKLVELSEQSAERSMNLVASDFDLLDYSAQLELFHRKLVEVELVSPRSTSETLGGMVRTFATNLQTTYVPSEIYPGRVNLVLASEVKGDEATRQRKHEKSAAGWQHFAPGLVTWYGPGDHMTMLKPPHVTALVDWLRDSLQREPYTEKPPTGIKN